MESLHVDGLTLFFPAEERAAAELVRQACAASIPLIRNSWGMATPQDVRVYIITSSWPCAMFHATPWRWRPVMVVSLPVWYPRGRRLWRIAGGWQQQLGQRRVVCVKPPQLLALSTSSPGDRLFIREDDPEAKVQQITCHELTHAFTAHLKLPSWLNEGLAMVTTERLAAKPMVRQDSLALLEQHGELEGSLSEQAARPGGLDAVVALYARGYWRTRYLEETRSGLLRDVLAQPRPHDWEQAIAAACHVEDGSFWPEMDATIVTYFDQHATRWVPSATANESTHRIAHGSRG
jgi:hypothetical protein